MLATYVLFAIHLGSRRVHVLGVTRTPDSGWVTQQARNLAVREWLDGIRFVLRDRDSKFSGPFDEVFRSEGVRIVKTPIRLPLRTRTPSGGPHRPDRVPGLDSGARASPPGAGAPDLRGPLQPGQASSGSRAQNAGAATRSSTAFQRSPRPTA